MGKAGVTSQSRAVLSHSSVTCVLADHVPSA